MIEKETTTLFKKVGRRYIPVRAQWYEDHNTDQIAVNSFRLTYAYADGGRRYEHDVMPATAPTVAAMMIARVAMENTLCDMGRMRPMSGTRIPYTKKQLAAIEQFKASMGGMYPSHWTENSAYEISEAAIKAVLEYRP